MEVNRQAKAFDERAEVFLGKNSGNHSSQDVARTAGCHAGITCWIDVKGAIGCGNDRPVAFENHVCVPSLCKILRDVNAIRGHVVDTLSDKPRHFTRMRSQNNRMI